MDALEYIKLLGVIICDSILFHSLITLTGGILVCLRCRLLEMMSQIRLFPGCWMMSSHSMMSACQAEGLVYQLPISLDLGVYYLLWLWWQRDGMGAIWQHRVSPRMAGISEQKTWERFSRQVAVSFLRVKIIQPTFLEYDKSLKLCEMVDYWISVHRFRIPPSIQYHIIYNDNTES